MNTLREILAQMLASEGALVEAIDPDGLEIVAPAHVQQTLALPEWSRVGFGAELPDQARRVSLESDWVERLEGLLGERGRYLRACIGRESLPSSPRDFQRLVEQQLVLENATFRLGGWIETTASYLFLTFRTTAASDEEREDVVSLGLNESTSGVADHLLDPVLSHLAGLEESDPVGWTDQESASAWSDEKVCDIVSRALPARIRGKLAPFLSGMERRMTRDLERLHGYYTKMQTEAVSRLSDKTGAGQLADVEKRGQMRLEAIEREYLAKVADLQRNYSLRVEVRVLQALRVLIPVCRVGVVILRKKGSRDFPLDWNPLAKRLDVVPCEGCWTSARTFSVCDDKLHLVCRSCLAGCPSCQQTFCRACHPARCPKCRQRHIAAG